MRFVFLVLLGLVLSSCGPMTTGEESGADGTDAGGSISSLSYNFEQTGKCTGFCKPEDYEVCTTKKSFSSASEYCAALRDSAFNKGCARSKRKDRFLRDCGVRVFEDTNIDGWAVACGSSMSDKSAYKTYPSRNSLCLDIINAAHNSCSADLRRALSSRFECN